MTPPCPTLPAAGHPRSSTPRAAAAAALAAAALLSGPGCAHVGIEHQALVARPSMLFSDSAVFTGNSTLLPQLEPGSPGAGGAQVGGCTSCR